MTAEISMIYAFPCKSTTTFYSNCFVQNTGTKGMVKFQVYNYLGWDPITNQPICVLDPDLIKDVCVDNTLNPYIPDYSGIHRLWTLIYPIAKTVGTFPDKICIYPFNCISGDNCTALTCSTWNTVPGYYTSGVGLRTSQGVSPSAISNFKLTPSDKTLDASWAMPGTSPPYVGFKIIVTRVSDSVVLVNGYTLSSSIPITNLTNGIAYRVTISAISPEGLISTPTRITAAPIAPLCTTPVIT